MEMTKTTVPALTVRVIAVGGFDLLARAVHRGTSVEYCLQYVLFPWGPLGGEFGALDIVPNLYPGHQPVKPPKNSAPGGTLTVAVGDTLIDAGSLGTFAWSPMYHWVPVGRKQPILFTPPKIIYKDYPQCLLAKAYVNEGKLLAEIQLRRAYGVNVFEGKQVIVVMKEWAQVLAIPSISLPNGEEYGTIVGSYRRATA